MDNECLNFCEDWLGSFGVYNASCSIALQFLQLFLQNSCLWYLSCFLHQKLKNLQGFPHIYFLLRFFLRLKNLNATPEYRRHILWQNWILPLQATMTMNLVPSKGLALGQLHFTTWGNSRYRIQSVSFVENRDAIFCFKLLRRQMVPL